ncbi:hypothetical protein D3C87_2113290 [compost metagenome]
MAAYRAWSARMIMLSALVLSSGTQVVMPPDSVSMSPNGESACAMARTFSN